MKREHFVFKNPNLILINVYPSMLQQSVSTKRALSEHSVSTQSIKIRVNTVGA